MKTLIIGILSIVVVASIALYATKDAVVPDDQQEISNTSDTPSQTESTQTQRGSIEIYDGISFPENTEVVDLSGRGLSGSLKAEIRMLSELRELDISSNDFTGLPAEIGQLSQLEILNLSNNPFTGLPNELGNLGNLKILDLRGTNYAQQDLEMIRKTLPASIQVLTD